MIKYALGCAEGHAFESWFPDSAAFEKQRKRGLVACPECNSTEVDKAIMAPAVVGGERAAGESGPEIVVDGRRRQAREFFTRMRREIEANTDDVGSKFPQVARAIHLGEEPERAIRGRATLEEARSLAEDGVGVFPLPMLEDELN
jgi:hypothetical protein